MNLRLLLLLFVVVANAYGVEVKEDQFLLNNRFVYYQVLYRAQGLPIEELNSVSVVEDSSQTLVFEHNGNRYTAKKTRAGTIVVKMPEGFRQRMLSFSSKLGIVLSQYE